MSPPSSLALTYRSDLAILTIRWLAPADLAASQAAYESLLLDEDALRAPRWLLDVRRAPAPPPELANWITYNWLPRAATRLAPAALRLAYLISPLRSVAIHDDAGLHTTVDNLLTTMSTTRTALFIDEGEAVAWLLEQPEA